MIEGIKIQALKTPFSQGIVMDKGVHLVPEQYTPYAKNIRIRSGTTTKRNGYVRIASSAVDTSTTPNTITTEKPIDNMISDGTYLYVLCDGKLYKADFNQNLTMTRYTSQTFASNVSILKYRKYLFFLSESSAKGYALDTSTGTGSALTITDNAYFRFGEIYNQNVWLVGGGANSNILYKSRAGNKDAPTNILDFDGDGSDNLYFRSKIMGLAATREQLFVFTEDTIEIISSGESSGILTITSVPIAGSNQPANHKMVVKADDTVFFWTKENMMKSINYMQGVTEHVVGDVSHRQNLSIKDFSETLDEDQSTSFGYYNRTNKTVHRHLKQRGEPVPNIVLVYDVNTDSFFLDTNKYFNCVTEHKNKYYGGSSFGTIVYQDDIGPTDDGVAIERLRKSSLLSVGSPDYRKEFRQVNVYGEKDDDVDINVSVLVDGKTIFEGTIQASGGGISGLASVGTGTTPVALDTEKATIKPFEYVITRGNLRSRGKNIQVIFKGESNGEFCLSGMEIGYKDLYDNEGSDKAKPKK